MKSSIILLDDHPLILRSVQAIIEMDGSFDVIAVCSSFEELFEELKTNKPDIIVLDISLPDVDGFEIFTNLRQQYPTIKTVLYTMHRIKRYMDYFRNNGANGYVLKSGELGELVDALKIITSGENYFPKDLVSMHSNEEDYENNQIQLTHNEKFTLRALKLNHSNKDIAKLLDMSIHEVMDIRKSLLFKTNCISTQELLQHALDKKWI